MKNGEIKDYQITASSVYLNYQPSRGRLGGDRGWAPSKLDKKQWLKIDLGSMKRIKKVATQGDGSYANWVMLYKLSYSRNGASWKEYSQNGKVMVSQ